MMRAASCLSLLMLGGMTTCTAMHTSLATLMHGRSWLVTSVDATRHPKMAERPLSYSEYLAQNRGSAMDGPPSYAEYLAARSGGGRHTDALRPFTSSHSLHAAPTHTASASEVGAHGGGGEAIAVDLRGQLPRNAFANCEKWLGIYTRRKELVNGRASYVKAYEANKMIWCVVTGDGTPLWTVGRASDKGEPSGSFQLHSDAQRLEDVTGAWWVYTGTMWVEAPHVQHRPILGHGPAEDPEPAANERSPQAPPPHAPAEPSAVAPSARLAGAAPIDVEPLQRRPTELAAPRLMSMLERRVADARALCAAAVDDRARPLMKSAIDDFMAGRIDATELERRRDAARLQAEAEYPPLNELYQAFAVYSDAATLRAKAEQAEAAAEGRLEGMLRTLEGQNGDSGTL